VISDGWADGGADDCSRWRCGGGDGETRWQQRRFRCVEIPISVLFPRRFILYILFLPSPRLSLSVSLSISPVFFVSQFRSFLFLHSRFLSLSFPPFSIVFLPPFPLRSGGIYRGRGSGVDPAPSHHRVHMVHVATSATASTVVANGGVAYGARLLGHLIMRWVAEHVGRRGRDKEKKTKTSPPQNDTISSLFFFWKPHEMASFCLKRAVSFKWKLAPKRQISSQSFNLSSFCIWVLGFRFLQLSP